MVHSGGGLPIIDGHEYVDLGLPSGTLWATMNLDATNVYDIGLYYRWGEVIGFTTGNTSKYKWNDGYNNPTKYNDTDGLTELELEDDAVHVNWGGGWVMPTRAQLYELVNTSNTTRSRIKNYLGSGVDGYIYKSKTNNEEIFFPDSGEYVGATKYNGTRNYYWTKTRGYNVKTAATFADNGAGTKYEVRSYFLGIRGVYNINI